MLLENKIALVTGASRGAGRAIALELAIAGADVYITGRSRDNNSTTQYQDLTLDETVRIIKKHNGTAIPITCDHTDDGQNQQVVNKIKNETDRCDILVNNVWAGYTGQYGNLDIRTDPFTDPFWEQPMWRYDKMMNAGVRAHYTMSRLIAPLMIKQKSGIIINTSFWDDNKYTPPVPYDLAKQAVCRMSYGMSIELKPHNVAALTLSLGWIRTEHLMRSLDVDDYKNDEELSKTESTRYAGRAIVALAKDPNIMLKTGKIVITGELAEEYNFDDIDGRRPSRFVIPDKAEGRRQR